MWLKQFLGGYKRVVAELKQSGQMSITESKQAMSIEMFKLFAMQTIVVSFDFNLAIFAHVAMLFCWNLVSRAVNVCTLMYDHIAWQGDCMVVVFPLHKGDREGLKGAPKHVYTNPESPQLCPILAFALYIFCTGHHVPGSSTVVFGAEEEAEKKYQRWFKTHCEKNSEELLAMGLVAASFGTHSLRKGSASYLSSIQNGPFMLAIYLRAGWSLGPVVSKYITEAGGNDQLCGRVAAGLNILDISFTALPPHFDSRNGPPISLAEWELILPGYVTFYPENFRQVIPHLLASLVFHRRWLNEHLHLNHPLRLQRVWTSGILTTLESRIFTGYGKCQITDMTASGIPPHILVGKEVSNLNQTVQDMSSALLREIRSLPAGVGNEILENFQVEGVVPLTASRLTTLLAGMEERIMSSTLAAIESRSEGPSTAQIGNVQPNDWTPTAYYWGGQYHVVPETFILKSCDVRTLWDLWWGGDYSSNIAPYSRIRSQSLRTILQRNRISKARRVIEALLTCNHEDFPVPTLRTPVAERDEMFNTLYCRLMISLGRDIAGTVSSPDGLSRRTGEMTYLRLYDIIPK